MDKQGFFYFLSALWKMHPLVDTSEALKVMSQRKLLVPHHHFKLFSILDAWIVYPVDDENDVSIVASDRE